MSSVLLPLEVSWPRSGSAPTPPCAVQEALEDGRLLLLSLPTFGLEPGEERLLTDRWSRRGEKNISLSASGERLTGASARGGDKSVLVRLLARYRRHAHELVTALLPSYAASLGTLRTSFRPVEAQGRFASPVSDDRLLHVDAFPASPTGGDRILRLFTNVSPSAERVWRLGEDFESAARHVAPRLKLPPAGTALLLRALGATEGRRTAYDSFMLQLHDLLKKDSDYQAGAPRRIVSFPPGSSWLAFTDQLLHAVVSGQFALEQTFFVPVRALGKPEGSPLRVLERLVGHPLVR